MGFGPGNKERGQKLAYGSLVDITVFIALETGGYKVGANSRLIIKALFLLPVF